VFIYLSVHSVHSKAKRNFLGEKWSVWQLELLEETSKNPLICIAFFDVTPGNSEKRKRNKRQGKSKLLIIIKFLW
jgi:hypothetical protein